VIVTTQNSVYIFDTDERTVTRYPAGDALRRDGEPIPVIAATVPVIGQAWSLILDLRGDGIPTRRRTSDVLAID